MTTPKQHLQDPDALRWTRGATAGPFGDDGFTWVKQNTGTFPAERGETGGARCLSLRGTRGRDAQGHPWSGESSETLSCNAHHNWLSLCGMPCLSCLLVILEMEQ